MENNVSDRVGRIFLKLIISIVFVVMHEKDKFSNPITSWYEEILGILIGVMTIYLVLSLLGLIISLSGGSIIGMVVACMGVVYLLVKFEEAIRTMFSLSDTMVNFSGMLLGSLYFVLEIRTLIRYLRY